MIRYLLLSVVAVSLAAGSAFAGPQLPPGDGGPLKGKGKKNAGPAMTVTDQNANATAPVSGMTTKESAVVGTGANAIKTRAPIGLSTANKQSDASYTQKDSGNALQLNPAHGNAINAGAIAAVAGSTKAPIQLKPNLPDIKSRMKGINLCGTLSDLQCKNTQCGKDRAKLAEQKKAAQDSCAADLTSEAGNTSIANGAMFCAKFTSIDPSAGDLSYCSKNINTLIATYCEKGASAKYDPLLTAKDAECKQLGEQLARICSDAAAKIAELGAKKTADEAARAANVAEINRLKVLNQGLDSAINTNTQKINELKAVQAKNKCGMRQQY